MDAARFSPSSPGRLVPTIDGAQAFVPDPVPRRLEVDLATVGLLADAENAMGRLAGTAGRLVNPYLVGSPLLHREAILSSRIEGTVTTPEQLVLLEAAEGAGEAQPADQDTREVLNYIRAMQHGLERLRELPVSLRLIREVHRVLLQDVRGDRERPGEFRTAQNWIGRPGDPVHAARFVPPPAPEMLAALDDFEQALHDPRPALPVLVRLAILHYQFETIHPFRDGNGRVGRLLMPLLLVGWSRLREPLLYLSAYFERHRDAYMDLLLRVSQTGDWAAWLQFFLRGVLESAQEAVEQAEGLVALRDRYHAIFQRARSSGLLQRLVDELFQAPAITIARAAKVLNVTPPAAAHNVTKLVAAGILVERTGRRRDRVFIAPEILAFMRDVPGRSGTRTEAVERTRVPGRGADGDL
jgi:Fic family protein